MSAAEGINLPGGGLEVTGPADRFAVTFFPTQSAQTKTQELVSLDMLLTGISTASARSKQALPWIKLATFGDQRTDRNCLRSNANVLTVTGIECDYDEEKMSFDDVAERLTKAGILSLISPAPVTHRKPHAGACCARSRTPSRPASANAW